MDVPTVVPTTVGSEPEPGPEPDWDLWYNAEVSNAGSGLWPVGAGPSQDSFPTKTVFKTEKWLKWGLKHRKTLRDWNKVKAGRAMDRWLHPDDYQPGEEDETEEDLELMDITIAEVNPAAAEDFRALGVPGGTLHGIYTNLLLNRARDTPWSLQSTAGLRSLWVAMRLHLRVLHLEQVALTSESIPNLFGNEAWPTLTHCVFRNVRLADSETQPQQLFQGFLAMPRIVYIECTLVKIAEPYGVPGFLASATQKTKAIAETHQTWGHWPFQKLRVLQFNNTGWKAPVLVPHLLLAGDSDATTLDESDYLIEHGYPRSALSPTWPLERAEDWSLLWGLFHKIYKSQWKAFESSLDAWYDPWPRLQYLSLRDMGMSSELFYKSSDNHLGTFIAFCMLWMQRARFYQSAEWNRWDQYEEDVAFPFYTPIGNVYGQRSGRREDLPAAFGDLRPWRFIGSALDFGKHGLPSAYPNSTALNTHKVLEQRAVNLMAFLHHLYLQCQMTQGRPTAMGHPSDAQVRQEQAGSLLPFLPNLGEGKGDAWEQILLGPSLGQGRSMVDGRGIAVFTGMPPSKRYRFSIVLDLVPAMLYLRQLDRPMTTALVEAWPESRREATYPAETGSRLLKQLVTTYTGRRAPNIRGIWPRQRFGRVTHLFLHHIALDPLDRSQTRLYRNLTGSGTAGARLMYELMAKVRFLTVLELDGGYSASSQQEFVDTPEHLRRSLVHLFITPTHLLRTMNRIHVNFGFWPLQELTVLALINLGMRWEMPWALVPIRVPLVLLESATPLAWDYKYLLQHFPMDPNRGHLITENESGIELLPRLMHLNLQGNRLLDVWQGYAADTALQRQRTQMGHARFQQEWTARSRSAIRRMEWFDRWVERCWRATQQPHQDPSDDWRHLDIQNFEAHVDTEAIVWSEPPSLTSKTSVSSTVPPYLLNYSSVDLRNNPLDLRQWSPEYRARLNGLRRYMYMSHLSKWVIDGRQGPAIKLLSQQFYEFAKAPDPLFNALANTPTSLSRWILDYWGRGVYAPAAARPLARGFVFQFDGDQAVMRGIHRLSSLSIGLSLEPLAFSPRSVRPEYGIDATAPVPREEILPSTSEVYTNRFLGIMQLPFATPADRDKTLMQFPTSARDAIVLWVKDHGPGIPMYGSHRRRAVRRHRQLARLRERQGPSPSSEDQPISLVRPIQPPQPFEVFQDVMPQDEEAADEDESREPLRES